MKATCRGGEAGSKRDKSLQEIDYWGCAVLQDDYIILQYGIFIYEGIS